MKITVLLALLLGYSQLVAATTNTVTTQNEAGAISNSSTIINGAPASPAVGFPGLAGSTAPPLLQQMPPPPYVLFGRLLDLTTQFGDMEVTGPNDLVQFKLETGVAVATFAPSPRFIRYKKPVPGCGSSDNVFCVLDTKPLTARFSAQYKGNVNWLGSVYVSSKPGAVFVPPADKQVVWNIINENSSADLRRVIIVPVPQGYGINVGVTSDGSALGISGTLSKLFSVFVGIGPSLSTQSGTTMVAGTWSQQYLVLEEDKNGMMFSIDLLTTQKVPIVEAKEPTKIVQRPDPVDIARREAIVLLEMRLDLLALERDKGLAQKQSDPPPYVAVTPLTKRKVVHLKPAVAAGCDCPK